MLKNIQGNLNFLPAFKAKSLNNKNSQEHQQKPMLKEKLNADVFNSTKNKNVAFAANTAVVKKTGKSLIEQALKIGNDALKKKGSLVEEAQNIGNNALKTEEKKGSKINITACRLKNNFS